MDLKFWQTMVMALIQGVTELFPISSVGHTVIIPGLIGGQWQNMLTDTVCGGKSCFLPMITALHLGTCVALFIYFWRDWLQVGTSLLSIARTRKIRPGTNEWVTLLIIVGCIPAGVLGLLFQSKLKEIFASPVLAAAFLVLNGSFLFMGEAFRRRAESSLKSLPPREREAHFRPLTSLSWKEALIIGGAQSLALIPGFSRSGMTIVAGLGVRMTHEDAARYSFLLSTPLILAANLLELPYLFHQSLFSPLLILGGMLVTGVSAYISTKFLVSYFETGRLDPFAYYCWGFGLLSLFLLLFVLHVQ